MLVTETQDYNIINDFIELCISRGYNESDNILKEQIMKRRDLILMEHPFKISQTVEHRKNGDMVRYRSFLPDKTGKRGKQVVKSSLRDLEDAIVDFYVKRDDLDIPTLEKMYSEWSVYYHDLHGSSPNTIAKYETDYNRFFSGNPIMKKKITRITEIDIELFFTDCIKSYVAPSGAERLTYKAFSRLYGYMDGIFRYAFKQHILETNPMLYINKKDFSKICRDEVEKSASTELIRDDDYSLLLEQLYKDMKKYPTNFAIYAIEMAALTGMRVGELAALKWEDVDFEEGVITVSRSDKNYRVKKPDGTVVHEWVVEKTKTGKKRKFPIDDDVRRSLDRIKDVQTKYNMQSEWLFPHPIYGWTRSNIISSTIKNKCKQLGFDRTYGIHALRKTLNSDMRANNAPAKMCASMLGNTVEVNNKHYYYDTSDMDTKKEFVAAAHAKRAFSGLPSLSLNQCVHLAVHFKVE